jgi:hypothetical protein
MARPFDDRVPSPYTGSSISSQTSLSANRAWATKTDETGYPSSRLSEDGERAWSPRRGLPKLPPPTIHGGKLAKIKSSPSYGTLAAPRQASNHGRLHKRGYSASACQSPISSTINSPLPLSHLFSSDITTPLNVPSDPYLPLAANHISKSKVMIKPLLRKLSSPEQNTIDLSRSAAENEGLGIYTSLEVSGAFGDDHTENGRRGGYHHRDASNNSHTSTSAPAHRYGTQYVHPMKQTPRPYTPPVAPSYQNSSDGDMVAAGSLRVSGEANELDLSRDAAKTFASLPPLRRLTPTLDGPPGSYTHFANTSQTNLPATPSSLRYQTDYIEARDMTLPTARSSLESAFRTRHRAHTDPAAQAATVAALRQKFNEKEAAKDLKFQQAEARKREKREEEERRKSEGINRKRAKSNNTMSEKSAVTHLSEHDIPSVTALYGETASGRPSQPRRRPIEQAGVAGKAVQSQWSLFWFKCKTMWLKLKRKMSRSPK